MFSMDRTRPARAAYYPSLVLSATGGVEGDTIGNWFAWPSRFWAVGPTMLETIFDGGRRRATSEGARANYDATVANYRQTALVAFQEVEDNLAALRILEYEDERNEVDILRRRMDASVLLIKALGGG